MKYVLMALAAVAIFAAPSLAADGNVSNEMLAKMGLSGISVMSDDQGTAVRGMGFVIAGSGSVVIARNVIVLSATGVVTNVIPQSIYVSSVGLVTAGSTKVWQAGSVSVHY